MQCESIEHESRELPDLHLLKVRHQRRRVRGSMIVGSAQVLVPNDSTHSSVQIDRRATGQQRRLWHVPKHNDEMLRLVR